MRLLFFGSGEFGLPTLEALRQRHEIVGVISQPDRPAGRHKQLTPTPIAQYALKHGLALYRVERVNDPGVIASVRAAQAEAAVVIAFGQKLGPDLLAAGGRLAMNLHASLLPKYRGAAPINWAILRGEVQTGVSVIALAERMDAGAVYAAAATAIDPMETAGELHDRLAQMGPQVVEQVLAAWSAGRLQATPQDETAATLAPKLSRADAWVDFTQDACQVARRVQGLTPWPGVKVIWRQRETGKETQLLLKRVVPEADAAGTTASLSPSRPQPGHVGQGGRVAVGNGWVRLLEVQVPGGRPLPIDEFVRGHPLRAGDSLGPLEGLEGS